jgi:hypothetical protein
MGEMGKRGTVNSSDRRSKVGKPASFIGRAFWQEVRQTRTMAVLLKKKYREGVKLSQEEEAEIGDQIIDLGKLIPLLTVLLLPGGTFALVLLERFLPFSILPSAFQGSRRGL